MKDEGRPLETDLQESISNHCMRLQLRVVVVSDYRKVSKKLEGNYVKGDRKGTIDEVSKCAR